MRAPLRRRVCRFLRIASDIPKTRANNCSAGWIFTRKFSECGPRGVWPSEGSVSEEAIAIAAELGVKWMATDEGVLSRTTGMSFIRDGQGRLPDASAEKLYNVHRYEQGATRMNMLFRDHAISDLIGFVYSGMPPQEAAAHLMRNIKESAQAGFKYRTRRDDGNHSRWRKCLGILSEIRPRIFAPLLRCPAKRQLDRGGDRFRGD